MTISSTVLALLITISTVLVAIAPVTLIVLWLRDRKNGDLW
jgi:hypothetical protein